MSTDRFNVVLDGVTLRGKSTPEVAAKLARLTKREYAFAERLLGGRPTQIKAGVDSATGVRYIDTLNRIDVAAHLEPETLELEIGDQVDGDPNIRNEAGHMPAGMVDDRREDEELRSPQRATAKKQLEYYRAAVGPRANEYYMLYFQRAASSGRVPASWNWAALLFSIPWALYRKLYASALALTGVGVVAALLGKAGATIASGTLEIGAAVVFAVLANGIYYRRTTDLIGVAISRTSKRRPESAVAFLSRKGGVHTWVPWVVVLVLAVGVLAAIVLPTYQDHISRNRAQGATLQQPGFEDPVPKPSASAQRSSGDPADSQAKDFDPSRAVPVESEGPGREASTQAQLAWAIGKFPYLANERGAPMRAIAAWQRYFVAHGASPQHGLYDGIQLVTDEITRGRGTCWPSEPTAEMLSRVPLEKRNDDYIVAAMSCER